MYFMLNIAVDRQVDRVRFLDVIVTLTGEDMHMATDWEIESFPSLFSCKLHIYFALKFNMTNPYLLFVST